MPTPQEKLRAELRARFDELYFKPGCFRSTGHPCGKQRLRLNNSKEDTAPFQPPFLTRIGPRYGEARRVVFVGLNPNSWTEKNLNEEETITLFDNYLDATNSNGWLETNPFRKGLVRMAAAALGKEAEPGVLPFVAWTNLIKCASSEDRGVPSYRMGVFCGPKVWPELELLKPELVICLGTQVHETLTQGAAQRGARVSIPLHPWSEFWAEIEVAGQMVGIFNAYHPSEMRTPNAAWSAINSGRKPNNSRLVNFLATATGDASVAKWKQEIKKASSGPGNPLLGYFDQLFLSKANPIPAKARQDP